MVTVFYGDDKNNLDYEIHKIIDLHRDFPIAHLYFDDNHQEIIDDVSQTSLFESKKIYLIHDASFLTSSKSKDTTLFKTLHDIDATIYLFLETKKTLNVSKEIIVKKIPRFLKSSKHALVNTILSANNFKFITSALQKEFEDLLSDDPFLVEGELNKLFLASDNNIIDEKILNQIINDSTELNIFKLTNHLLNNDKKSLIKLYDGLIALKYQPMELIQIIASQLFTMKLLKLAIMQGYSIGKIETELKIPKYVQFVNRDVLNKISATKLDQIINDFTLLDYNLKHNLINPYHGLKLALVK
jgi:DNA polymerase-3 subunit delta